MLGSITQYTYPDVEDLIDSNKGNMNASYEDNISNISEKENEIVNIIPTVKATEYNKMNSRIEQSFAKNKIE